VYKTLAPFNKKVDFISVFSRKKTGCPGLCDSSVLSVCRR
jgi:hypothetical protein